MTSTYIVGVSVTLDYMGPLMRAPRNLFIALSCTFALFAFAACGDVDEDPDGFALNNGAGTDLDMSSNNTTGGTTSNNTTPVDMGAPPEDMPAPVDMAMPPVDMGPPPPPDMSSPPDMAMPPVDMGQPDMPPGGGGGCTTNDQCGAQLCCPSFTGAGSTCQDSCTVGGGLCASDTECRGGGERCCDVAGTMVCSTFCADPGGVACTNNSECSGNTPICCPDLQGTATCQNTCMVDGLCRPNEMDCAAGQTCCDLFGQANVCFDQCPF